MLKKNEITDIFFDLDHTLWDFEKNSALAFHKVFETHKLEIDLSLFLTHYETINIQYWKLYREDKVTKQELRRGRLCDTFDLLKHKYPLDTIDAIAESYIDCLPHNNFLFQGATEILNYLHPKYNLHIITNGFEEVQHKKLINSKIDTYFKTITNSEQVGVKKPNPKIFHYALFSAKTIPEKSVMIGDNLEADIMGAKQVGMHTIHFNGKSHSGETVLSIKELGEIKIYL